MNVDSVIENRSLFDVIEAGDKVCNCGLSCSGRTHKSDLLSRLCPKRDVMENSLSFNIGEGNMVEHYVSFHLRIGNNSILLASPCPHVRLLFGFDELSSNLFCIDEADFSVVSLRLLIDYLKDTLSTC